MTTTSRPYNPKTPVPNLPLSTNDQSISPPHSLPIFKTAYGPKDKVRITFTGPGRTKQSFKDECNINTIMARYMTTGVLDFATRHEPHYGDTTGLDFRSAMETVAIGRTMFEELPAHIRDQFENDPAEFLEFVHNPENKRAMAELGLLTAEATSKALEATPLPAPVTKVAPEAPRAATSGDPIPPTTKT